MFAFYLALFHTFNFPIMHPLNRVLISVLYVFNLVDFNSQDRAFVSRRHVKMLNNYLKKKKKEKYIFEY